MSLQLEVMIMKTAPEKKVLNSRKVKLPMKRGFISNKMIMQRDSSPVVKEGMSVPPAGTPAALKFIKILKTDQMH